MSNVNFNISVVNSPQLAHHQNELNRAPILNQQQNADLAKQLIQKKLSMPVEPEKMGGKIVDAGKRQEDLSKKKKRKKEQPPPQEPGKLAGTDSGTFIDIEA